MALTCTAVYAPPRGPSTGNPLRFGTGQSPFGNCMNAVVPLTSSLI
jgi:hypothetical protein